MASLAASKARSFIKHSSSSLAPHLHSHPSSSPLFSTLCGKNRSRPFSFPSQSPPSAKKAPFILSAHGRAWQDPYHWMSDTSDPDLTQYLERENAYTEAFMGDTHDLQRTLFSEMTSRMAPHIATPPERWGPWLYHEYIPEGKEYPFLCRKLVVDQKGLKKPVLNSLGGHGEEEVLLDWNAIAERYGSVHVGECRVSRDHNFLAYTFDVTGSERFMLKIRDLRNGFDLPKSSADGVVSLAWALDGSSLFYTLSDENQRPNRVLCRRVELDSLDEISIFTEIDSRFCVDIASTKDGQFITVNSNSRTSSEVYLIDAMKPQDGLKRVRKRVGGVQYFLEHHHGFFYILTNAPLTEDKRSNQRDFYLARCPVDDVDQDGWESILLPGEDISLEDMDMFDRHLVLTLNRNDSSLICSIDMPIDAGSKDLLEVDNLNPWYFPVPSNLCSMAPGSNHDFMTSVYRVVLSSPVMPDLVIDYDMSQHAFSAVHQDEVPNISHCGTTQKNDIEELSGKDFGGAYSCERKEVVSHDGAKVPLTILYSREAWRKGRSPGILQVYGAYGEVLDTDWRAERLSLLDRGWVVAFAHVRGGGGGGPSWHKSGTGLQKLNSIYDFVSCGEYLMDEDYVHRDRLGAMACSAGCLLVGATLNMYPGLFGAAVLRVPFLDILNTLLDPGLPLTISDYEEFGDPRMRPHFDNILCYSPYDNIPRGACLPSLLITASFLDSRVGVWEAAKWVSRARDVTCPDCSCSILLKTNMNMGHLGRHSWFGVCEETAYEYAFMIKAIG